MKGKHRYYFEDAEVTIKRIPFESKGIPGQRPNLMDNFFWDIDIPAMNWNEGFRFVIERVLARGKEKDWIELVRFYGKDTVLNVFRNQSMSFWPDGIEERARKFFELQPEDLVIYHRRLKMPQSNIWKDE